MDFASALQKLEQTANAAAQQNNNGRGSNNNNNNNHDSNQNNYQRNYPNQPRHHGGGRGRLGQRDGGGYSHSSDYRGGGRGGTYGGRGGGGGYNSNFSRRRGRNDSTSQSYQNNYDNQNDYNRRNTRPRLGSDGGRSGDYYNSSGNRGGGRGGGRGPNDFHRNRSNFGGGGSTVPFSATNPVSSPGGTAAPSSSLSPPSHRPHPPRPLEEMQRFGFRIDPYVPPAELPADLGRRPFHICLLAIIIDQMPYEHIWRQWALTWNNSAKCRISLLIHAKYPEQVQSDFVRQHLITKAPRMGRGNSYADPEYLTHTPAWGSVQITRAMVDLLRMGVRIATPQDKLWKDKDKRFTTRRFFLPSEAVSDGVEKNTISTIEQEEDPLPVDKFLYISETCLPVQTLSEFVQAFFGDAQLYQDIQKKKDKEDDKEAKDGTHNTTDNEAGSTSNEETTASAEKKRPSDTLGTGGGKSATKDSAESTTSNLNSSNHSVSTINSQRPKLSNGNTRVITPWEVSWVNARSRNTPGTPRNKYEKDQFADIHRMVHGHYRWKADQWLCLSRCHAEAVLNMDSHVGNHYHQIWNTCFKNVAASDEMYFPSCLAVLQIIESGQQPSLEHQPQHSKVISSMMPLGSSASVAETKSENNNEEDGGTSATGGSGSKQGGRHECPHQVALRPVTYTDWSEGMRNPATFANGMTDLERVAKLARRQGSLVARKFALQKFPDQNAPVTGAISADEWTQVMNTIQAKEEQEKEENAERNITSAAKAATTGSNSEDKSAPQPEGDQENGNSKATKSNDDNENDGTLET